MVDRSDGVAFITSLLIPDICVLVIDGNIEVARPKEPDVVGSNCVIWLVCVECNIGESIIKRLLDKLLVSCDSVTKLDSTGKRNSLVECVCAEGCSSIVVDACLVVKLELFDR